MNTDKIIKQLIDLHKSAEFAAWDGGTENARVKMEAFSVAAWNHVPYLLDQLGNFRAKADSLRELNEARTTELSHLRSRLDEIENVKYHIVCPHCNAEMEDSKEWGCPDEAWEEDGQCPYCEGEFRWSRTEHHCTYKAWKMSAGNENDEASQRREKPTI